MPPVDLCQKARLVKVGVIAIDGTSGAGEDGRNGLRVRRRPASAPSHWALVLARRCTSANDAASEQQCRAAGAAARATCATAQNKQRSQHGRRGCSSAKQQLRPDDCNRRRAVTSTGPAAVGGRRTEAAHSDVAYAPPRLCTPCREPCSRRSAGPIRLRPGLRSSEGRRRPHGTAGASLVFATSASLHVVDPTVVVNIGQDYRALVNAGQARADAARPTREACLIQKQGSRCRAGQTC